MLHPIEEWLKTSPRDYAKGVHLYSVYGEFKSVLQLLQKEDTPLTRAKLKEVMQETWAELKPQLQARQQAADTFKPKISIAVQDDFTPAIKQLRDGLDDAVLDGLDKKWKPLYAEMGMLHARLGACTTNEQRFNLAMRITELDGRINGIWAERDKYIETGQLSDKPARKVVNTAKLSSNEQKELTNLRTYVSRMQKSVMPGLYASQQTKPTPRRTLRITENEAKLAAWQKRIKELEHE